MSKRHARPSSHAAPLARACCEALESRKMLALIVPQLNSVPGAAQTLYLDFDGSSVFNWDPGNGTNYLVKGPGTIFQTNPVPAFTIDADAANFSAAELTNINNIWAWVAEKFSPFTINVTTVDPGVVMDGRNMTCLIAGSNSDWYTGSGGGVADIHGFHDGGENTCFAFSADAVANGLTGGRLEQFLGETVAHEAGHEVGLTHQRTFGGVPIPTVDEYYDGDSIRAPIMGASSNNTTARGIWWLTGNWPGQNSPDVQVDELAALTQDAPDRLFFRQDDYNVNTPQMVFDGAGVLTPLKGVIGSTSDIDGFAFQATSSIATFTIKNAPFGGMLAPSASIRISGTNTVVPVNYSPTNTNVSIQATNLTPGGNYVLMVGSQGGYGDVGQYSVEGTMATFASYSSASQQVNVGGFVGNNNVTLSVVLFNNVYQLLVQDSLNGGPLSSQMFPVSTVNSVSVNLGSGNDTLNIAGLFQLPGSESIFVLSNLGGGSDTLRLGGGSSFLNFSVGSTVISWTFPDLRSSTVYNFEAERVELLGTASDDVFRINSQNLVSKIYAYGDSGNDTMIINPEVILTQRPIATFYGGAGTSDTLEFAGSTIATNQYYNVWNNFVARSLPGSQAETDYDSAVERVAITGGAGDDSMQVYELSAGTTAYLTGNGGADGFWVGEGYSGYPEYGVPFSDYILGAVSAIGGPGDDRLTVNDINFLSVGNYAINSNSVRNTFYSTGRTATFDVTVENVDFYARDGGSTTTITTPSSGQDYRLFGGGGAGTSTLIFDDRLMVTQPFELEFYSDKIVRKFGNAGSFTPITVEYSGYEALTLYMANVTHSAKVFGTAAMGSGQQNTIVMGTGADTLTLYPHDVNGNLTLNGNLGLVGGTGADKVIVDDTGSTSAINYVLSNTFGPGTQNIYGLGTGGFGASSDVETIDLRAGGGNDTFALNTFQSGAALIVSGGAGYDTFEISPTAHSLPAAITNMSFFSYDGGTGDDHFNVHNYDNTSAWTITRTSASISFSASTGYSVVLNVSNVGYLYASGGTLADQFLIRSTPAVYMNNDMYGAGGNDTYTIGNAGLTNGIASYVNVNGFGGTDSVVVDDSADPVGRSFHINSGFINAVPGDTLFASAGGSIYGLIATDGITGSITVKLGSGADTVYFAPVPIGAGTYSIQGNSPTTSPGDTLTLALAGVTSPVFTPGVTGAGSYTFGNRAPMSFTGIETRTIDSVAPTLVATQYVFNPSVGLPSIDFQFSENVAPGLFNTYFDLDNLTTGQTFSDPYWTSTYDSGTNIAHYRYTGLASGVLPDGNYRAYLDRVTDLAGNLMTTFVPPNFFVLAGDANHDARVDTIDFNTLAANFSQSGTFNMGDFNYDGFVDTIDFNLLAGNFSKTLVAPPAAPGVARPALPEPSAQLVADVLA